MFQDDQKRWFARLTYTDVTGQRRNVKRRATNKMAAKEALKQLIRDLEDHGERSLESAQLTFTELAAYYAEGYLKPAEYREGRKISGLRSVRYCELYLRTLKEYSGTANSAALLTATWKPSSSNAWKHRRCAARNAR